VDLDLGNLLFAKKLKIAFFLDVDEKYVFGYLGDRSRCLVLKTDKYSSAHYGYFVHYLTHVNFLKPNLYNFFSQCKPIILT
jgi:hypothetical protein